MKGSVKGQVNFLMSLVNGINSSKHQAKAVARSQGTRTWHDLGKNLDVYSYSTMTKYFNVWCQLGEYAKQRGVKSFDKINSELVKGFMESKLQAGLEKKTLQLYASALEKLEVALNRYREQYKPELNRYDFSKALKETRTEIRKIPNEVKPRAYDKPEKVIEAIKDKDYRITAEVQYKAGARVHEIAVVKPSQMLGYRRDIDGQEKGVIRVEGKGGKVRDLLVPKETYDYIKEMIDRRGIWQIDKYEYRQELKRACESIGETYHGTHGLRWNYAEERLKVQTEHVGDFNVALGEVSKDMGHDRADITLHYLKRK